MRLILLVCVVCPSYVFAQCLQGDCRNGQGTFRFPEGHEYTGAFVHEKFQGYGRYTKLSGDVYEGVWINNALDSGVCRYIATGNRYEGRFRNGKRHGKGVFYFADGRRQEGVFNNGAMTEGRLYYANGDIYDGECREGKRHGYGVMYFADGQVQKGIWEQDQLAKRQTGDYMETYAVIIGIADYQYNDSVLVDLTYCDDDARRFYQFLQTPAGGSVPSKNMLLLIDAQAGADSILTKTAQMFAAARKGDRVIFFFSGHGSQTALLPYDGGKSRQIAFSAIKSRFKQCRAKLKWCIVDACNSGAIKMPVENIADKNKESDSDASVIIMTSSRARQASAEMKKLKGGVYSHFLLRGLEGAADRNLDHIITVRELHDYLLLSIGEMTGDLQSPQTFGKFDGAMPLVELKYP